ncbi:MAG: U32 family peptidase [Bacilli bacterium]|nr:U32 family peptidase [Bacilli bacterium]MBR3049729.1 U32 family peptidase [Bacilli bacterium]
MKKVELLSPAGDLERLKVTLLYGADAVYIGGERFGLRANATNFSIDEIKEGCKFAHKLNKKVYLTLNIVFHNEDIDEVEDYIKEVVDAGIDAFIVSDPCIISYIKENFDVEVHLSTQNSTTNYETVKYFKDEGIDRVVLARELSKSEIKEIIDKVGVDIEVFIHGAMCTCFSGRCALSNYVTNRDANRGGCAQVCRFSFINKDNKEFTMATKDLNMARYISDLIDIGVVSLKVEGRMRSLYYLATVIGTYRKIIDDYYDNNLTEEKLNIYEERLSRVANREVSSQYFLKEADYTDQYYTGRKEESNQDYLGQVISYDKKNKLLKIYERNYFKLEDKVELFTPKGDNIIFNIEKIYTEDMEEIDVARHPDNIYYIYLDTDLVIDTYSMIRLIYKSDYEVKD